MPGGKTAGESGKAGEDIIGIQLAALGFYIYPKWAIWRKAKKKSLFAMPKKYAVHQMRYESIYRPNTNCQMDWGCFIEDVLVLHIESKVQTGQGSAAAKSVASVYELEDQITRGKCPEAYLIIPHVDILNTLPNCDADYFRWAERLVRKSTLPVACGDVGACGAYLVKRFRTTKRIIEV
jgi:hypothetical protein